MLSKILRTIFQFIEQSRSSSRGPRAPRGDFGDVFRANLRQVRRKRDLTYADLARRCQYEAHYLEQIERGEVDPSLEAVRRLAKALSLDPRELLFGSSGERPQPGKSDMSGSRANGNDNHEPQRRENSARIVDERLEEVQEQYDQFFRSAPIGFVSLDANGEIVELNHQFKSMIRREESSLVGQHINGLVVPEDHDELYEYRRDLMDGNRRPTLELRFVTPGNEILVGSLGGRLMQFSEQSDQIGLVLREVTPLLDAYDRLKQQQSEEMKQARDANPLTGLPGNVTIRKTIASYLESDRDFSLIYADIDHFKSYNDRYGFERGDEVLLFLRDIFRRGLEVFTAPENFLGHVGGDDFVVMTSLESAEPLCEWVIKEFDRDIPRYYDESDREQEGITVENRQGETEFYPFLTLSLAVVKNENGTFENYLEMSEVAAEVKSYLKKTRNESTYMVDRRNG